MPVFVRAGEALLIEAERVGPSLRGSMVPAYSSVRIS